MGIPYCPKINLSDNPTNISITSCYCSAIRTVSYIAKQCGIANWDKVFDMSKLTPEDDFEEIVMNNAIFGRVTPDQKADIIGFDLTHQIHR